MPGSTWAAGRGLHIPAANLVALQAGQSIDVLTSGPNSGPSHTHRFRLSDQSDPGGAPVRLEPDPTQWPLPPAEVNPLGGRANVEIYNMPAFMSRRLPPMETPPWRYRVLYTYASATPADPQRGMVYPFTADRQASVLVAHGSAADPFYTRAICGFEAWRLQPDSFLRQSDSILQDEFQLWPGSQEHRAAGLTR
jgi:hypothetical protein